MYDQEYVKKWKKQNPGQMATEEKLKVFFEKSFPNAIKIRVLDRSRATWDDSLTGHDHETLYDHESGQWWDSRQSFVRAHIERVIAEGQYNWTHHDIARYFDILYTIA